MSVIHGGFTPTDNDAPVLISRDLFEYMLRVVGERDGKTLEAQYSGTVRGTTTYVEATVFEMEDAEEPRQD